MELEISDYQNSENICLFSANSSNDKFITDVKNYLEYKGQCKDKSISQKIHIFFLHDNACETSYINIYVDLVSITLIYSVLLHGGLVPTIRS